MGDVPQYGALKPALAGDAGEPSHDGPILLYDGVCTFCNGTVRFVLRHDRRHTMRFAPLQGSTARVLLERHPETRMVDSLVLVDAPATPEESVTIRSDALVEIARYLGGPWRVWTALRFVPRPVRDWGYRVFARFRYRLFGRYETCPIPSDHERKRFLP